MMPLDKVYEYLCNKDPRSDMWETLYGYDPPDEWPKPRTYCSCDNCFYGRDRLALEILELREKLWQLEQTENPTGST